MTFELRPLGDVCKTTSGGTPSRSKSEYFQGTIPWVKSGELLDGIVVENSEYISEEAIRNSSAKLLPAGTLLVALYGATVGRLGILSRSAATNQAVCAIFPSEVLDTKFLFWYLLSKRPWLIGQAAGGAQPNISQGIVRSLLVPVMPIQVQHKIVAEIEKQFSRLDEAVANLKRVKANLKRYKASVLKDAVEGRLVPTEAELARREGRSFETGDQLLQRIEVEQRSAWHGKSAFKSPVSLVASKLPDLPIGWLWAAADQVCSQITDGEHIQPRYQDFGYPMLTAKNVRDGHVEFDNVGLIAEGDFQNCLKRCAPAEGDVLIVSVGATTGRAAIVGPAKSFALVRSVLLLKPLIPSRYLLSVIQSSTCQTYIQRASGSTAQAHLYIKDTRSLPIPMPPLAEQERIVAEVDRRLSLVQGVELAVDSNLKRAQALRQATLSNAFVGAKRS